MHLLTLCIGSDLEGFSIGKGGKPEGEKKKKLKPEQKGEERMKETFNYGGNSGQHEDLKRKREEYAVALRKKKKYASNC